MPRPIPLRDILPHIDIAALGELAEAQLDAGGTRHEAIDDVVAVMDALIPWDVLIPGPVGATVEALSPVVARAIARFVVGIADATRKKRKASVPG
jgi:hypothetical protein